MAQCTFCKDLKNSPYTCPRCNSTFCSVRCYQNEKHSQCSENFYQKCVQDELKYLSGSNNHSKQDEIRNKTVAALKRLEEHEPQLDIQNESLDSDDDEDIADRFEGVDLEDADKVWEKLVESEKLEFEKLLESGEISKFIPKFVPWWDYHFDENTSLIEEFEENTITKVKSESFINELQEKIPKVDFESVKKLSILIGDRPPSPLVKFGIVNVAYAYAYVLKYNRVHSYCELFKSKKNVSK